MGDWRRRFPRRRQVLVLAAALVLPFSSATAATTHSPATAGSSAKPLPGISLGAHALRGIAPALVVNVPKISPLAASAANGRKAVVEGTVKQRIRQVSAMSSYDVPEAALAAYRRAASRLAVTSPGCHIGWPLLAGIGTVESDNGQYGGAVVLANGDISPHILGPVLNGTGGVGAIGDTDNGRLDGDRSWDRAVGPMQFIPSTWALYGADGNGDGLSDPDNIFDAALAAADYLCSGGGDMRVAGQARDAVLRYNHSGAYATLVLSLARAYAAGEAHVVPNGSAGAGAAAGREHAAAKPPAHRDSGNQGASGGNGSRGGHGGSGHGGHGTGGHGGSGHGGHGNGGHGNGGGGDGNGGDPPGSPVHRVPTVITPPVHKPSDRAPHEPPGQAPKPVVITGVLTATDTGWSVGDTALNLGDGARLSQRQEDYNGDGRVRTVRRELTSLEGQQVALYQPAVPPTDAPVDPTQSSPADPAAPTDSAGPSDVAGTTDGPSPSSAAGTDDAAPAVVIWLGSDGIVVSINGLTYEVAPTDS